MKEKNNKNKSRFLKAAAALLVCAVLLWLAGSYVESPLTDRAVVLGLGIDYDGEYTVTAEVVAPGGDNEGGGSGQSKVLTGKGETLPLAIHDIYGTTGKNPSLGQTGIVLLGQGMKDVNLSHALGFFVFSDAFKDGVTLAWCDGDAKDVFSTATPVDSMVSFGLQTIIQKSGKKTGVSANFMQNFIEDMTEPSGASYVTNVRFIKEEGENGGQKNGQRKEEGSYDCSAVSVFKNGSFVATLDDDQSRGFAMIFDEGAFDNFAVKGAETLLGGKDTVSVGIASKKVEKTYKMENGAPSVTYDVKVRLGRIKTDVSGNVVDFLPKTDDMIDDYIKNNVKEQISALIEAAVSASVSLDCDFMRVADGMYKALGGEWTEYMKSHPDYLSETAVYTKLTIEN